jgi:hypothetical protein
MKGIGKRTNHKKGIAAAALQRKREEAKLRQEAGAHLSAEEKIALARSRPGESKREIARLEHAIKEQKRNASGAKQAH